MLEMLSVPSPLQQEARWWLVPAVLQRSGLWLPRHHIWQHDRGQHHHAGKKKNWMTHLSTLIKFLNIAFPNDLPATLSVCVFSWCPSPISSMWWWCPICTGTLWAMCVQAWWVVLASCLGLIMATPTLFLKQWVFGSFTVGWTHRPLCFLMNEK